MLKIKLPHMYSNLNKPTIVSPILLLIGAVFLISLPYSHAQDLLLKRVNYLNVEKGSFQSSDILIEDGKIKEIKNKISVSSDVNQLNASGKYLMPGLIDAHIHLFQSGGLYTRPDVVDLRDIKSYDEERKWLENNSDNILRRYMHCGVTTVVDVGGPMANFELRKKYEKSSLHPSILLTGPLISTYQPEEFKIDDPPIIKVNSTDEARAQVQKQVPYKPDFIKIWYIALPTQTAESTYEIVAAAIDESHKNNLKVAVHATELNTAKLAIRAGCDLLVHSVDDPVDEDFIKLMLENDVSYIPTLIVHRKYVKVFSQTYEPTNEDFLYANPEALGSIMDPAHMTDNEALNTYKTYAPQLTLRLNEQEKNRLENLKTLVEAGVNVVMGTDAGNIGTQHASSIYEEMSDMQKAGLQPADIIRMSTINAAKAFEKEKQIGSIEPGKLADLLLLNKNPLDSLANLQSISHVIRNGVIQDVDTIVPVTPAALAQQQLNAYNAQDIEAFLAPYSDSVKVFNFPDQLQYTGIDNMRNGYANFFKETPNLHCEVTERIVLGNTVIDREIVTGFSDGWVLEAIAIYKIWDNKIQEIYFIR